MSVDLISDALPYSPLWYSGPNAISNAIGYAKFFSRSHDAVIRVYDEAGNVIETHEHRTAENALKVLRRAVELGVNLIDTTRCLRSEVSNGKQRRICFTSQGFRPNFCCDLFGS